VTKRTEEIIDGLLSLSDRIFSQEEWLTSQAKEQMGNVAIIEVYDLEGTVSRKLKLRPNLQIVETDEDHLHRIRMHTDTLLDLLNGDLTFGDAWTQGEVEFYGEDYNRHAVIWARSFEKLRGYISDLGG